MWKVKQKGQDTFLIHLPLIDKELFNKFMNENRNYKCNYIAIFICLFKLFHFPSRAIETASHITGYRLLIPIFSSVLKTGYWVDRIDVQTIFLIVFVPRAFGCSPFSLQYIFISNCVVLFSISSKEFTESAWVSTYQHGCVNALYSFFILLKKPI